MTDDVFHVDAIPSERLEQLRTTMVDDAGNGVAPAAGAGGGEPLRCCLRLAEPGEPIVLVAYRPFELPGPYAETGPVFVHAERCAGYAREGGYPDPFRGRAQVFRCYGCDGAILGGRLAGPFDQPEAVVAELFADLAVERIHTRNVVFGCYMLQLRRAG